MALLGTISHLTNRETTVNKGLFLSGAASFLAVLFFVLNGNQHVTGLNMENDRKTHDCQTGPFCPSLAWQSLS